MKGEITVLVRVGNLKRSIEHFGNNRYLCRVESQTEDAKIAEILEMLSKYMGIPVGRFQLKSGIGSDIKVFELS